MHEAIQFTLAFFGIVFGVPAFLWGSWQAVKRLLIWAGDPASEDWNRV